MDRLCSRFASGAVCRFPADQRSFHPGRLYALQPDRSRRGNTARRKPDEQSTPRQEVYRFELDFNAESLGLSKEQLNAFGSKMLQFELTSQQKSMSIRRTIQSSVQKTLRKPAEVIGDLAKALGEVMSKPGNKAVLYELDEEARQAIMGDAKVTERLANLF